MITEANFRSLLKETLLPMFPGISVGRTDVSTHRHSLVAYGNAYKSVFLKPHKDALYRVPLLRSLPFKPEEFRLISTFAEEVTTCCEQAESPYFTSMISAIPSRVIAKYAAWPDPN